MALRESGEDYLESIYVLSERQGIVRSIDVAEYLGVTKASVSKAMATLESNDRRGAFLISKSSERACEFFGISKYSFYSYLNEAKAAAGDK